MFDGHLRAGVAKAVDPVGARLHRAGVTADHLTAFGVAASAATATVIATGHLLWAAALLALAGAGDLLDGPVAKAAGTTSVRGAFFDSVSDRLSDALVFFGVAWHLLATRGDHYSLLPMAILGAAALVSYTRAKADALGYDATGGLMERAERFLTLGFALLFPVLLMATLWVLFTLTALTAIQRFVKVWRQADRPARSTPPRRNPRPGTRRSESWRRSTRRAR